MIHRVKSSEMPIRTRVKPRKNQDRDGHAAARRRAEVEDWLSKLSAGLGSLPPLPKGFSRGDFYSDHD